MTPWREAKEMTVCLEAGDDVMHGGAAMIMRGGAGNATMAGGEGNDRILSKGDDVMHGGSATTL